MKFIQVLVIAILFTGFSILFGSEKDISTNDQTSKTTITISLDKEASVSSSSDGELLSYLKGCPKFSKKVQEMAESLDKCEATESYSTLLSSGDFIDNKIILSSAILEAFLYTSEQILDQEKQLTAGKKDIVDPKLAKRYKILQNHVLREIQQANSYNRFIRHEEYMKYGISNRAWDHFMYCYVRLEFDDTDIHDLAEIKPILDLYNADILKTSHTTLYIFDILSAFSYQQEGLVKLCSIINAKKDPEASDAAKAIKLIFQAAPFVVSKAPATPKKVKEELISRLNELNSLIQKRIACGHPVIQLSDKPIFDMFQAFADFYRSEDRSSNIWR